MKPDLHIHPLPDASDAATLFARLHHQPWAMLLESMGPMGPDNRFDIITADPRATLTTRGRLTQRWQDGVSQTLPGDPLSLLAKTQQALLGELVSPGCDLPFIGGALGLFGYDLGRHFEQLPEQAEADLTIPDMAVGIYDWALIHDKARQQWQLVHWGSEAGLARRLVWWNKQRAPEPSAFQLLGPWQSNMSRHDYGAKFAHIQDYLAAGDCYQINLTQRFSAPYQGDEWLA